MVTCCPLFLLQTPKFSFLSSSFLVLTVRPCYRNPIHHYHLGSQDNYSVLWPRHIHSHMHSNMCMYCNTNRLTHVGSHSRGPLILYCCKTSIHTDIYVSCPFCTCASWAIFWLQTNLLSPKWVELQLKWCLHWAGGTLQFWYLFSMKLTLHFCLLLQNASAKKNFCHSSWSTQPSQELFHIWYFAFCAHTYTHTRTCWPILAKVYPSFYPESFQFMHVPWVCCPLSLNKTMSCHPVRLLWREQVSVSDAFTDNVAAGFLHIRRSMKASVCVVMFVRE